MTGAYTDDDAFYDEEFYYDAPLPKKGHMSKIVLNIARLRALQLADRLQVSLTAIAADATTFTGATALLAAGTAKHDALMDAHNLVESLRVSLSEARTARDVLLAETAAYYEFELAAYVDGIAKGDAGIILSAGLQVAQPPGPTPAMTKVEGVTLRAGGDDGTAVADWDTMYRSRSYEVQVSSDPANAALWTTYDIVTTVGLDLSGLPSGQKRWVRVRAINSVNKGPWSDPACCTIP